MMKTYTCLCVPGETRYIKVKNPTSKYMLVEDFVYQAMPDSTLTSDEIIIYETPSKLLRLYEGAQVHTWDYVVSPDMKSSVLSLDLMTSGKMIYDMRHLANSFRTTFEGTILSFGQSVHFNYEGIQARLWVKTEGRTLVTLSTSVGIQLKIIEHNDNEHSN